MRNQEAQTPSFILHLRKWYLKKKTSFSSFNTLGPKEEPGEGAIWIINYPNNKLSKLLEKLITTRTPNILQSSTFQKCKKTLNDSRRFVFTPQVSVL